MNGNRRRLNTVSMFLCRTSSLSMAASKLGAPLYVAVVMQQRHASSSAMAVIVATDVAVQIVALLLRSYLGRTGPDRPTQ